MSYVIGDLQQEVLEKLIAKEIKRYLRNFAKTTEMERSNFDEFLQDWLWSVENDGNKTRLYQAYIQIEGRTKLIKIDF